MFIWSVIFLMKTFCISNSITESREIGVGYIEYAVEQERHIHEGIEIVYIAGGKGMHIIDDMKFKVQRGTLIMMDRACVHSFVNVEPLKYYVLMFQPSFLSEKLKKEDNIREVLKLYDIKTEQKFFCIDFNDNEFYHVKKIFEGMIYEKEAKSLYYANSIHGKFEDLMASIVREYVLEKDKRKEGVKCDVFDDALEYITEHCCDDLILEDVAKKFGYKSTHFSRMLKKKFGFSFKQLVVKRKIDKVIELVWEDDDTISNIIFKCGFTNLTYFYEMFKKYYNTTPNLIVRSELIGQRRVLIEAEKERMKDSL